MKRAVVIIAVLSLGVVAYAGAAQGLGTSSREGRIRPLKTGGCVLAFAFDGFAPGSKGRIEIQMNGTMHTAWFQVPSPKGALSWDTHDLIGTDSHRVLIHYRIAVDGMSHQVDGSMLCKCEHEEGGGGGGGGGNSSGGGGISDAGSASPVSTQPGFAG